MTGRGMSSAAAQKPMTAVMMGVGVRLMSVMEASEVAAVLLAVVASPFDAVLSRPPAADCYVDVWYRDGRVCLALGDGLIPERVMDAEGPDGRRWEWGCQRDWLADGAPIIDPLTDLLAESLGDVMGLIPALPQIEDAVWPDFEAVAERQANALKLKRRKRRKAAA